MFCLFGLIPLKKKWKTTSVRYAQSISSSWLRPLQLVLGLRFHFSPCEPHILHFDDLLMDLIGRDDQLFFF